MKRQSFKKPEIEIVALCENDIIVTSGIPLPDDWWGEENGET